MMTEPERQLAKPGNNPPRTDPMDGHRCRMIAKVRNLGPGRNWWLGELLEPIPGHPQETHCLHIKTPYKSVVWGVNMGDMYAYAILAHIVHGRPIHIPWLEAMADLYRKEAMKEKNNEA